MKTPRAILGLPKIPLVTPSDVGEAYIGYDATGVLMVSFDGGAYAPIAVSTSDGLALGGAAPRITSSDGSTAAIAAANQGALRYNDVTKQWEASIDGGAYAGLVSAPAGVATADALSLEGAAPRITSLDGLTAGLSAAGSGAIRYNDTTKQWEASVDGGAYAPLGFDPVGQKNFLIPFNNATALTIKETANNYITCTTISGASAIQFGNSSGGGNPNTFTFFLKSGQTDAFSVSSTSGKYISCSTSFGGSIEFGNGGDNPEFKFAGDGPVILGNLVNDNSFLRIFDRTTNPTAAAGAGDVYTRDISANTELFYQDDSSNTIQMTAAGQIGSVASAAYTRNATAVEDRTLLASASATTTNNNNVLAALILDLQNKNIIG